MRWAFWRTRSSEPEPPLPGEVGLPTPPRPPAAAGARDADGDDADRSQRGQVAGRSAGAVPGESPEPRYDAPLTAPDVGELDRAALAAAGTDVAAVVRAAGASSPDGPAASRALAVAATGALAARLPSLSGVDGAAPPGEPEDELLHAYADLLVSRAEARAPADLDRDDLLAVAHVAAAAAAVGAANEPSLLLLNGLPADEQLRAAALLLAQTADDGGGPADALPAEVRTLFGAAG